MPRRNNLKTPIGNHDWEIDEFLGENRGLVVAEVEKVLEKLPRVDIPGDWIDFVIPTGSDLPPRKPVQGMS